MPSLIQLLRFILALLYSGLFWLGVSFFLERRRAGWFSLKFFAVVWLLVCGVLFYGVVVHGPNWLGPEWLHVLLGKAGHALRSANASVMQKVRVATAFCHDEGRFTPAGSYVPEISCSG